MSHKKVFFIGFHKTATTAFFLLFRESNYKAVHTKVENPTGKNIPIAKQIVLNKLNNRPILYGIDDHDMYCDFHHMSPKDVYDGNIYYQDIYNEYKDSYFIMQTRPTEDWLQSRLNHPTMLERYARGWNISLQETKDKWLWQKEKYEKEIPLFFKNRGNFIKYDITKEKIYKIINFVKADFTLYECKWQVHNKTTNIREEQI